MQLHHPDSELPVTRVLFDPSVMAARILPWMNADSLTLSIVNIRYKPQTSCVVSYEAESGGVRSYCHAKAFRSDEWPVRKRKFGRPNANLLIDDEFSFALFRFPIDSELPAIKSLVTEPQEFVSKILFERFQSEEFSVFETLAYKPNRRWTGRLKFKSGNSCVLKIHDASTFDRARTSADILKRCSLDGLPTRAGKSNRYRTLAYEWIDGIQLDLASNQTGSREQLMEQVFEYLDRLHGSVDRFKKRAVVQQPATGIEAISNYLADICPPVASMVSSIGQNILAHLPSKCQTSLIHGDFHERQVLVSGGGVRVCDFDSCCIGDPTSDFANFVSHLRHRAHSDEVPMELAKQVDEWSMRHLRDHRGAAAVERYQWHQTAALYRLATHSFRNGSEDWVAQTEHLLLEVAKRVNVGSSTSVRTSVQPRRHAPLESQQTPQTMTLVAVPCPARIAVENDPKFGFLAEALDIGSAEHAFKQHVPEIEERYGAYSIKNVEVRRHKAGRRCLIEYKLATDSGKRSILGKVSAKRLDIKTFNAQTLLHEQHGFGYNSPDGICVPQTIGYFRPWRMWFQQKEDAKPGIKPLKEKSLTKVAGNIAATLVKLHTSGFTPARKHLLADELRILEERLTRVATEFSRESGRIAQVLNNCVAIANTVEDRQWVPTHRDFYHDQIMFSRQRTVLVDLDLLAYGHPAIDPGNFLAHLTEYGIRYFDDAEYWRREEDSIVDQYLSGMPTVTRSEIEVFKAISLARHIHTSWSRKDRRRITSRVIDETTKLVSELLPVIF